MIKGILFDFDGTLSNRIESAYRKYTDEVKALFPMIHDKMELEAIVQRCMTWDEYGTIAKRHVFEQLKKYYHLDIDIEEKVTNWYKTFYRYQVLQDDCIEVLKVLKQHYRLGVVTNGESTSQALKIDYLELRQYFDVVLISGDIGIHKPEIGIYQLAAEKMGLKCEEIVFVGDTFNTDILGAYRSGMEPVWLFSDSYRKSDLPVKRITQLKEILNLYNGNQS